MKRRIPEGEDATCKGEKTSKREKECKNSEKSDGEGCGRSLRSGLRPPVEMTRVVSNCHVELVETSAGWDTMQYFTMTMTLMTVKHGNASKGAAVPYHDREQCDSCFYKAAIAASDRPVACMIASTGIPIFFIPAAAAARPFSMPFSNPFFSPSANPS